MSLWKCLVIQWNSWSSKNIYVLDVILINVTFCLPYRSVTPQTWQDFSQYNTDRANAEIRSSTHLREAINSTIKQTDNDLEAQRQASEFALRKRIHEMEQAKDEDEWQKKNVSKDFGTLHEEVVG